MSKILHHLREAANEDTVLLIIDNVLPYACRDSIDSEFEFENTGFKAPEPLLPNYGGVRNAAYTMDITVHYSLSLRCQIKNERW